jgi:hypothetical protein
MGLASTVKLSPMKNMNMAINQSFFVVVGVRTAVTSSVVAGSG